MIYGGIIFIKTRGDDMSKSIRFFHLIVFFLFCASMFSGGALADSNDSSNLFSVFGDEPSLVLPADPGKMRQELLQSMYLQQGIEVRLAGLLADKVFPGVTGKPTFSVTQYRVDSTYYTQSGWQYREYYSYDKDDNYVQFERHLWNAESSQWEKETRIRTIYDAEGRPTETIFEEWSLKQTEWVLLYRYVYAYNEKGRIIQFVLQAWSSDSSKWVNGNQGLYEYDAVGRMIRFTLQVWDREVYDWFNSVRWLYEYHSSGWIIRFEKEIWDRDVQQWVGDFRYLYTYNDEGYLFEFITQNWDTSRASYVNVRRWEALYEDGLQIQWTYFFWEEQNGLWIPSARRLNFFDSQSRMIQYEHYKWNRDSSRWDNWLRGLYFYNSEYEAKTDSVKYQCWVDSTGQWMNERKEVWSWDVYGNLSQWKGYLWERRDNDWMPDFRRFYQIDMNGIVEHFRSERWDRHNNAWVGENATIWFRDSYRRFSFHVSELFVYTSSITGLEERITGKPIRFHLYPNYPNPFNPETVIPFDLKTYIRVRLEVYNALGQRVRTLLDKALPGGRYRLRFHAADLPSGIYYIRLRTSRFQQTRSMVLIR